MADGVELIPVDDQDIEERVFRAWEDGKGPQALAREFAIPIRQIEEIIDRMLPTFDAKNQLFAFSESYAVWRIYPVSSLRSRNATRTPNAVI